MVLVEKQKRNGTVMFEDEGHPCDENGHDEHQATKIRDQNKTNRT